MPFCDPCPERFHGCRKTLLGEADAASPGAAFMVKAMRQLNVALVVSRGLALPRGLEEGKQALEQAAESIGQQAGFRFAAGPRATHHLWHVPTEIED